MHLRHRQLQAAVVEAEAVEEVAVEAVVAVVEADLVDQPGEAAISQSAEARDIPGLGHTNADDVQPAKSQAA